ncbi:MAG: DUF4058 family protein [Roseiflexaceae bacterium]|nr:DUF4058 family protein [Roseiflexus sp.]MDW8213146.1 DUF4058 family protein [Roseiflexaceae bacterium]
MPSPFPGMDPYLEGESFQESHERLAHQISVELMPQIRPRYVALLAKRYVLDCPAVSLFGAPEQRVFHPDVHVVERQVKESRESVAAALAVDEPSVSLPSALETPQLSVESRDVAERRLVTLIEILSPASKYGAGYDEYQRRRLELLKTETHLLEIDLLRQGARIALHGTPPPAPYYVYLSRFERRPYTDVWCAFFDKRLPRVPVPLPPPDADAVLDLQHAVDACFALVGYDVLINYTQPPPPAMSAADLAWIEERLRATGVRPATTV